MSVHCLRKCPGCAGGPCGLGEVLVRAGTWDEGAEGGLVRGLDYGALARSVVEVQLWPGSVVSGPGMPGSTTASLKLVPQPNTAHFHQ